MKNNRLLALIMLLAFIAAAAAYALSAKPQSDGTASGFSSPLAGAVVINEAMASNSGAVPSEAGGFYDWIELHNPGAEPIDISSWGLTDAPGTQARWAFATGTVIPPGGYLLVFCSGYDQNDPDGGELHASFRLGAGTDVAVLLDNTGGVADAVTMLASLDSNHSIGRSVGDPGEWLEFSAPTPGFPNDESGRASYEASLGSDVAGLTISELQSSNRASFASNAGDYPDWIELANDSPNPIDISGFGLSDDREDPMKWIFPRGTTIAPGERLLIICDSSPESKSLGELHASFSLSSYIESAVLSDAKGKLIDAVDYESIPQDCSYVQSGGEWTVSTSPTPGS